MPDNADLGIQRRWQAPCRPRVYYYEIVECVRCATLSDANVYIFPNTVGQVAASVQLAIMFEVVLFVVLDPYAIRWHT